MFWLWLALSITHGRRDTKLTRQKLFTHVVCLLVSWNVVCFSHEAFMLARGNGVVVIETWLQKGVSMFSRVNDMAVMAAWFRGKRFET